MTTLTMQEDAQDNFLDGAKNYRLRVPPKVPINNFWSVLVYDSLRMANPSHRSARRIFWGQGEFSGVRLLHLDFL